ncbi:hypothetical protein [Mycobacterium palustre]|uniref:hypothetical protein n=1 Tax=Mycobacterium palustre TaxID=153971 RepID=UPI0021F39F2C|nr:hypothetical protein [Mycobacterium palustre]MCV7099181.1 hypothetical protein [Mycobacterium palustre]
MEPWLPASLDWLLGDPVLALVGLFGGVPLAVRRLEPWLPASLDWLLGDPVLALVNSFSRCGG